MQEEYEQHRKIISDYFNYAAKPTFNGFTSKYPSEIKSLSASLPRKSAVDLHRSWCSLYNKVAQVKRPNVTLVNTPANANATYCDIFNYHEALDDAETAFEIASIKCITYYANRGARAIATRATATATNYNKVDNTADTIDNTEATALL